MQRYKDRHSLLAAVTTARFPLPRVVLLVQSFRGERLEISSGFDWGCQKRAGDRRGEGWVAEEALAIGLYAALSAAEMLGKSAIPKRWLNDLELRQVIEPIADDLATSNNTIDTIELNLGLT